MKGTNRWPPIFGLGLTAVLVFLVLPNPLRIPQNNPAAQAEYAPVPGDQDDATNANFGETGSASSGGIGAGGTDDLNVPIEPIPEEPAFHPSNKRCYLVDGVERQTLDPLSPPCVRAYPGQNPGPTYQGVTKDEILVIFYNDMGVRGDMNQPWVASQEAAGHETSQNGQDTYLVRTIKALFKYFHGGYQTYGRRVHLIAVPSNSGITSTCSQRQIEATVINRDYAPFAVVHFGDNGQCFLNEIAKGIPGERDPVPGFGLNADVPREEFQRPESEGLVWGFFPDQETMAGWSASFICRKLKGGEARFAGDVTLQTRTRKFGLTYPNASSDQRGPSSAQMAGLLIKYLGQECGMVAKEDGSGDLLVKEFRGDGGSQAPSIMLEFFQRGVTTVICYCVPVLTEVTVTKMQSAANGLNYHPEWYWDHTSRMFRHVWNERYGDEGQEGSFFGTSYHWRNRSFEEQYWYQAFTQMEPGAIPNTRFGFDIYHLFLNLFQGLQGAGPDLNPDNVKRGMFTFKYQDRDNPFLPIGGYGSTHKRSVSPYTFIDTAMAFYWDPRGTPPGESDPNGCLRAVRGGYRYHAGEWPMGDDDLFDPASPCYQDDTRISEAGTIGF